MSGTSHDGLDLAHCIFTEDDSGWTFGITHAETIPYSSSWKARLLSLIDSDTEQITIAGRDLGEYIGKSLNSFIKKYDLSPEFIGSHGHTILHQPEKGISIQIGDGEINRIIP